MYFPRTWSMVGWWTTFCVLVFCGVFSTWAFLADFRVCFSCNYRYHIFVKGMENCKNPPRTWKLTHGESRFRCQGRGRCLLWCDRYFGGHWLGGPHRQGAVAGWGEIGVLTILENVWNIWMSTFFCLVCSENSWCKLQLKVVFPHTIQ